MAVAEFNPSPLLLPQPPYREIIRSPSARSRDLRAFGSARSRRTVAEFAPGYCATGFCIPFSANRICRTEAASGGFRTVA